MAILEFPQTPLHVSCTKYRSHCEVEQARIRGVRGALRAKPASENVSSGSIYAAACRGFGSVSRRAVNCEIEGLAGIRNRGRQQRRGEPEAGDALAGTQRHDEPCAEYRGLAPVDPSIEISVQTGEKSKRLYKNFRNNYWDELPSRTLSRIGRFLSRAIAAAGRTSSRWSQVSEAARVASPRESCQPILEHLGMSMEATAPVRLDEQGLMVTQKHVHGLKGRGGTRMIQDLRNRRFHGGTQRHGNPPRRLLQTIRRSSRRPARSPSPPTARLR